MNKWVFYFLFTSSGLFAQIGIEASAIFPNQNTIQDWFLEDNNTAYQAAISYRLTPFQKRLEFMPALSYTQFDIPNTSFQAIGLQLGLLFYPFDFEGDCDCPTFSKKGTLVKKGFFFELLPTIHQFISSQDETEQSEIAYGVGAGLGLDIGVSDHLTITPFLRYQYYPSTSLAFRESLTEPSPAIEDLRLSSFSAGVRAQLFWN